MDQDNTKPGPAGAKGSWRDRLGISKELPKISDEFKDPQQTAAPGDRREPDKTAPLPRPGVPVAKPAPMAPRANAAELGDRLRKQREAAERMAEQRVAEAKERALREQRPSLPPASGEAASSAAPRPRFSFADTPPKPEQPQTGAPPQHRWSSAQGQAPGSARPVFTADRPASQNDPKVRSPAPPPRQPGAPMPPSYARSQPPAPQRVPPPHSQPLPPPALAGHRQQPRPSRQPPPAYDPYRRDASAEAARQLDDPYAQEDPYRRPGRHQEPPRARNMDFRSAHSRELDYVEEETEGLFEEDQTYTAEPRRATQQEYSQAYREYEGVEEEKRRRTGPFLLIAALMAVGAIAGGLIYFYQKSTLANQAAGEGNVPVVSEPSAPVKTEPEPAATAEEDVPATQQQSMAPSTEMPAASQKKQIYDRILGETTLEEQEQVVPSEEQPVAPDGPVQGFDADPLPLPLPPPPGGSTEDQSGSLEPQSPSPVSAASTKSAAENVSQQASPAAANLETGPDATGSPPQVTSPEAAEASAQPVAPKPEPKAATAAEKIDNELAFAEKPAQKSATPAGSGPIQIAQLASSETPAAANQTAPSAFTAQPQVLPDVAEGSPAPVKRRGLSGRARERIVSNANTNFNKAKSVEVAAIEEAPVTTQSIAPEPTTSPAAEPQTAPQQAAPQQQAALQPRQPAAQTPVSHATGPGFVIQLASYKSEVDALAGFEQLRQRHGTIVGSLTANVVKADLGANGTFYRLHLGSFSSKQAAKTACTNLLAAGERDCLVKAR